MSSAVQICRTRLGNVLLRQQPVRGWRGPSLSLALARHPRSSQLAAGSSFRNATTLSTAGKNAHSQNHTADEKSQNENGSSSSEQNQSQQGRVLYERRPDWYIRLIPLLIVLDIAMFANFGELVVNHWTEPVVAEVDAEPSPAQFRAISSTPAPVEQVLKPAWKRWGTAGGAIALASAVAGLLLVVRGRVIRRIVLLPPAGATGNAGVKGGSGGSGSQMVLIQTASDRGAEKGRVILPSSCEWGRGRDAAELFVSIPPKRGRFGLTFNDALVLGQKGSVEENRRRFEDAWRGTRTGGGRWAPLVPVEKKVDSYYS